MLRTVRLRLRLEPCEDRALPAAVTADVHPVIPSPTEHRATSNEADEYADPKPNRSESGSSGGRMMYPKPAEDPRAEALEYARPSLPASPPLPQGPTAQTGPAVIPVAPSIRSRPVVVMGEGPAAPVAVPLPPAPVVPESAAGVPSEDEVDGQPPVAAGGGQDVPITPEAEVPSVDPIPSEWPLLEDLDLHVNLAGWANSAAHLLDGLDAVLAPLEGESPWARLGYWALAIGTVGVTVELTRQGLRTRLPERNESPTFPGTR